MFINLKSNIYVELRYLGDIKRFTLIVPADKEGKKTFNECCFLEYNNYDLKGLTSCLNELNEICKVCKIRYKDFNYDELEIINIVKKLTCVALNINLDSKHHISIFNNAYYDNLGVYLYLNQWENGRQLEFAGNARSKEDKNLKYLKRILDTLRKIYKNGKVDLMSYDRNFIINNDSDIECINFCKIYETDYSCFG